MQDIPSVLRQEAEALRLFVSTLEGEQLALKKGDTERLSAFVEQKNRTAALLGRLSQQRNSLLLAARFVKDREGLLAWGQTSPDAAALIDNFLALAEEAKELNRLNGQLITMHLNAAQGALAAITPQHSGHGLYSAKGQTTFHTGYRLIDSV